jgi:hypothetical protein
MAAAGLREGERRIGGSERGRDGCVKSVVRLLRGIMMSLSNAFWSRASTGRVVASLPIPPDSRLVRSAQTAQRRFTLFGVTKASCYAVVRWEEHCTVQLSVEKEAIGGVERRSDEVLAL